jgi:predicted HicB family RNase H-like nuclease
MNGTLEYKGYTGSVTIDAESRCLHGKIEFINDLVTFEGDTVAELETAFKESVDDYLATCQKIGKAPDKPFRGTFNIRIGAELHRLAAVQAMRRHCTLNEFICRAVASALEEKPAAKPNARTQKPSRVSKRRALCGKTS